MIPKPEDALAAAMEHIKDVQDASWSKSPGWYARIHKALADTEQAIERYGIACTVAVLEALPCLAYRSMTDCFKEGRIRIGGSWPCDRCKALAAERAKWEAQ